MKEIIVFLLICLNFSLAYSQSWDEDYYLNFEEPQYFDHLFIDTVTFLENTWQIGPPQKNLFNNALSAPNTIITDMINSYPANNTSVFIIKNLGSQGSMYGLEVFDGYYYVQSDSLNDYGLIEFSPDNGNTWIDLINDTVFNLNIEWWSQKPVLTGNSGGWINFEVMLMDIGSAFNMQFGDTIIYRFTFISDSISEDMDGLMYDNFHFWEFVEGISEVRFKPLKTNIFPNPSAVQFTIEFENPHDDIFQLAVYDFQSKLVISKEKIAENKIVFDTKLLAPGVYYYKLTNSNRNQRGWGKFIVVE